MEAQSYLPRVGRRRDRRMEELKPCPFCGSDKAKIEELEDSFNVQCGNYSCLAYGPDGETREKAIEAWNKRIREE